MRRQQEYDKTPPYKFKAIRRALEAQWLTNDEIAEELGVPVGYVHQMASYLRTGNVGFLPKKSIAEAFGVK